VQPAGDDTDAAGEQDHAQSADHLSGTDVVGQGGREQDRQR
jgi:hypothetical protein